MALLLFLIKVDTPLCNLTFQDKYRKHFSSVIFCNGVSGPIFSSDVFIENLRGCHSLGVCVVSCKNYILPYLCHCRTYTLKTGNICSLSKEQHTLLREITLLLFCLKLSSANSSSLGESKICRLGKGYGRSLLPYCMAFL